MDPPSYDEATTQPTLSASTIIVPASRSVHAAPPSVAPPSYEATTLIVQPDPFPVLSLPTSPTSNVIVHQPTFVNTRPHVNVSQTVVVSQPQQVQVIAVTGLLDTPGRVRCSRCQHVVTTKIRRSPSSLAYILCIIIAFCGLFCGFCLIPFLIPSLWLYDHYCPLCNAHLHTHYR
uniref:lipopolysaccharide-induced tumor necrosis factor-alpha factor homolog n=1 Tax=Doryrhamphus excisus TaxID=161450 RepID=UPI0025ADEAD1|nr:lipopolysaccharide-induced tumor necrosis factor-alpha factor homolog [Doryrhamphus excisus]